MDPSDQRRKRKRILRQSYSSSSYYYLSSVRSLVICFSFFIFIYLLSKTIPLSPSSSSPVLLASSLSLLSSSTSRTVKSVQNFGTFLSPLRIKNRVLFPDHVLLFVSGVEIKNKRFGGDFECVNYGSGKKIVKQKVISFDEYDEFGSIVRCPLPPMNYSSSVNLNLGSKNWILGRKINGFWGNFSGSVKSWENVVYEATLDGDSVVVFVKGLNLRPDRESNPSQFTCHFGLGKWERNNKFMLTTKALSAAQEIVRCSLPMSISRNRDKARGIRMTVGMMPHVRARAHERVIMPSVAKIFNPGLGGKKRREGKYELCVCTMLWNQAPTIREWIMYHSWLGVERWFVYDNNSDDGIDEVIEKLDSENYNVTRHVWPWIKTQEAGFSHCALRAKEECNWVSFMDVDEYFYFPSSNPEAQVVGKSGYGPQASLRALVANFSSSSSTVGEIRTSCHSFGPSGLNSRPVQGVTVGYTCRLQSPERHKSIIRPDAIDTTLLNVVHHFHLKKGFEYINLPQSVAIINHYKYQVWEVFRAKFYRRVATYVVDWRENQNEGSRDRAPGLGTEAIEPPDWPTKFCEVWDTGLRDLVRANLVDGSTGLLPWEAHYD